jgi:hypothetical protein
VDEVLQDSGALEVLGASTLVVDEFITTMASAGDLDSAAALEKTLIVLLLYGVLWAIGLLGVAVCFWKSKNVVDYKTPELNLKKNQALATKSKDDIRKYLVAYIDEVFPAVYQTKLPLTRLWSEIKRHHRYFVILSSHASYDVRMLTTVQLLTVQAMLMFVLALCYDLQFPQDDGSCEVATTKSACIHMKAFLGSKGPCTWSSDPHAADGFSCTFDSQRNSDFNIKMVIIISIVVAIFAR